MDQNVIITRLNDAIIHGLATSLESLMMTSFLAQRHFQRIPLEGHGSERYYNEARWRKYIWIGHILRKPHDDFTRTLIDWNPQERWKRGRPSNTWMRKVTGEVANVTSRNNGKIYITFRKCLNFHTSSKCIKEGSSLYDPLNVCSLWN